MTVATARPGAAAAGLGAVYLGDGRTSFRVWAPFAETVALELVAPDVRRVSLSPQPVPDGGGAGYGGYFAAVVDDVRPGTRYRYRLDGADGRPDPASRHQPDGVHGPSAVVDLRFDWRADGWAGRPLETYVLYEVHIGTFTAAGTFEAAMAHLDALVELGVTALELMPVAQFPGARNWGYDGVLPFAVQSTYGGPDGLRRLVDACHARGLAVVLDVVYNHLGPEGNVLGAYGPYFTDRYHTPWGDALNFDGPGSDEVRRFFIENARQWIADYRIDGLRLDAVHAIVDAAERPFLAELAAAVEAEGKRAGRSAHTFAESAINTRHFLRPRAAGGCGMDAQWCDDFHHALHALLTGERAGYYRDFGAPGQLARAYRDGFVYTGQYSAYRGRRHGVPPDGIGAGQLVVCAQNHDQIGNRARGERLSTLVSHETLELAAGALLLAPFLPLLFMGEEYGEEAPFLYFVDHSDPELVAAVREGRRREFAAFAGAGLVPDPADPATFARSRLDRSLTERPRNAALRTFYRALLRWRRAVPALAALSREQLAVLETDAARLIVVHRWTVGPRDAALPAWPQGAPSEALVALNVADRRHRFTLPERADGWRRVLDSAALRRDGAGRAAGGAGDGAPGGPGADRPDDPAAVFDGTPAVDGVVSIAPRAVALFVRGGLGA